MSSLRVGMRMSRGQSGGFMMNATLVPQLPPNDPALEAVSPIRGQVVTAKHQTIVAFGHSKKRSHVGKKKAAQTVKGVGKKLRAMKKKVENPTSKKKKAKAKSKSNKFEDEGERRWRGQEAAVFKGLKVRRRLHGIVPS